MQVLWIFSSSSDAIPNHINYMSSSALAPMLILPIRESAEPTLRLQIEIGNRGNNLEQVYLDQTVQSNGDTWLTFNDNQRESRDGGPLLSVRTEANEDSRSTYERVPSLVGLLG